MKKTLITCFAVVSASLFSQNIAYVSQTKILSAIPDFEKFNNEKEKMKKSYEEELQKDYKINSEKVENLLKSYDVKKDESMESIKAKLKPLDLEKLNLLVEEEKFVQKKKENYEKQLTDFNNNKIDPILSKINKSIEDYSKKNKIDAVYVIENFAPALAYINKQKEITDKIIEIVKK